MRPILILEKEEGEGIDDGDDEIDAGTKRSGLKPYGVFSSHGVFVCD